MATRDLRTAMTDEVFETINGYDSSTDKLMFDNYGDKDNMTRTTDNWMHALAGSTGIPALNSRTVSGYVDGAVIGGVLLTPRHLLTSRHAAGQVGNVFHFWDRANNVYSRTAIGAASAGDAYTYAYGDYVILTLDSDLPSAIEPAKVFPPNLFSYFDPASINGTSNTFIPSDETLIVSTDQEEKSLIHRVSSIVFGDRMIEDPDPDTLVQPTFGSDGRVNYGAPIDAEAQGWRETMIPGDSGSPFFAIVDGELIFLGVAYTASTMSGLTNYRVQNDINILIANADADAINRGSLTTATGYTLTEKDMSGYKQYIDGLEYSFIGEDISSGFNIMYRGAAIDHNGFHYSIPYAASSIVRTDPRDNSQVLYSVSGFSSSSQKWVDALYAPNKRIYAASHAAPGLLEINTEDPDNVTVGTVGTLAAQSRGIALVDNGNGTGRILTTSYSGSQVVRRYAFDQNGATGLTHTSYTYPIELDPYFQYRDSIAGGSAFESQADIDLANLPFIYHSFWGAVNGGNGKVYGIPFGSAFVMVIDTTDDDSVTFLTDYPLSGNAAFSDLAYNSQNLLYTSPQWNKYRGGILADNGCIYTHGTHARAILKIDTSDDSVTEIAYPQEIVDAMVEGQSSSLSAENGNKSTSFFSYEGPDGKIYNTAWNIKYQVSIDPTDDSIEYTSLSAVLENQDASNGWYTAGATDNNTSFIAPGVADRVLQINYPGYSPAAYASVTPFSSSASPSPTPTISNSNTQTPTGTPTQTKTPTQTQTPTPSKSEAYVPPVTLSFTGTPTQTPTQTVTPTNSSTPQNTPSITPSNSEVPSQTPTQTVTGSTTPTPTGTPTPSNSRPNLTATPTPTVSNSNTQTPTPTPTPSITPSNNFEKCVELEYDVADGPDRFIVTYKGEVIIDTGFVGNSAYQYGNNKRQVFIDALVKENLDLTGVELAADGYPTVNPLTEGSKEAVVAHMNERDATIKIQSPVHDKPGWEYRLHCPMDCVSPTPTQTQTQTSTQTPTPTPSKTPAFSSPAVPSPTPSGTPTPTSSPTPTPSSSGTPGYTPTQTPTQTPPSTPTQTGTPVATPTATQTATPSSTAQPTPSTTNTPPATPASPTPTSTPESTPTATASSTPTPTPTGTNSSPSPSPSNTPQVTPSHTPPSTPTLTSTPSNTPPSTPTLTATPSNTPSNTPPTTPSNTPPSTPTLTATPSKTGTPTPTVSDSSIPSASPSSTPNPTPSSTPQNTPSNTPQGTPPATPSPSALPTYGMFSSSNTVSEGDSFDITLFTTNLANGTLVPYTITGIESDDIVESLTGNFTVNNDLGSATFTTVEDDTTEGSQIFKLTLDGPGDQIDVLINDTSVDPDPSPTPTPTPSGTPPVTPSNTPQVTPSNTPQVTPCNTPQVTPSTTPQVTPSNTPQVTPSHTPPSTPTLTATPSNTPPLPS